MANKLSANFMAELFKLIYLDPCLTRIAVCNLTYQLIPKEWPGYKFLLKEAIEVFADKETVPSLGTVSQKYIDNDFVQEAIEEVKKANKVDRELIIDQLESYIKDVEFQLLSKKVHDLYEDGKKEEAIQVNASESQRILQICLRQDAGTFQKVFKGFDVRMQKKRNDIEISKTPEKVTFGIDRLDEISYGGTVVEDTVLWIMRSGIGKALSLDSDIITPNGITKIKDIKVGDLVIGSSGQPQSVIGVYYQGLIDCYRVTFSDGTIVECNDKHIWRIANRRTNKWENIELGEILKRDLRMPGHHDGKQYVNSKGILRWGTKGRLKWKIPCQGEVSFKNQDVKIDPYTLGAMLGDGCLGSNLSFTSIDSEIVNRLKFPESISIVTYDKVNYRIKKNDSENDLKFYLNIYGLKNKHSYDKFIPKEYIFNSREVRLELLRGILDTDGYVSKGGVIELALTSKQLIEDTAFVARSLGCLCHKISKLPSSYKNSEGVKIECRDNYRLRIVPPKGFDLFHLKRKSERLMQEKKKNCIDRMIESIEYIGKKEMQCIEVSNEDGLFLTNNFIVTHNSTVLRHHGMSAALDGHPVLHIQLEGGIQACLDKYDQYWTGQKYNDIRRGYLEPSEQEAVMKAYKSMKEYGQDIDVYGFEKFGEATMVEVRNLVLDYHKANGYYPKVLILDSLDLVLTGINKVIDNNPSFKKDRLQKCAQLFKNICVEFKMVGFTSTQASDVPIDIWDNSERVIDRSYTEGDKTLVKPFSYVFTGNMTMEEKKTDVMRIYNDKIRDFKESQEVIPIATDYDHGRFYDRARTNQLFNGLPVKTRKNEKPEKERKLTKTKKV